MKQTLSTLGFFALALLAVSPAMARGGGSHSSGVHYVAPHVTKNGTYVEGHMQTNPNGTKLDNWSTKGNVNPYTGQPGTKDPYGSSSSAGRVTSVPTVQTLQAQQPVVPASEPATPPNQVLPFSPN